MNLSVSVPPLATPISVAEAKAWLKVTDSQHDTKLDGLVRAATGLVETITRRALVQRTMVLRRNGFPAGALVLPSPPLRSVSSIAYTDSAGDAQTWAAANYQADVYAEPGTVCPVYGVSYPATKPSTYNTVTVTYKAGYAVKFTAATSDTITATGHAFADTDRVRLYTSGPEGCALPGGLSEDTDYYVRDMSGETFKLAASSGGSAIDITSTGTGTGVQHYVCPAAVGVVPREIRTAMLMLISHWFENPQAVNVGNLVTEYPINVDWLLQDHRVLRFDLG